MPTTDTLDRSGDRPTPFRVAASYLAVGLAWILFTDRVLLLTGDTAVEISWWQTLKGVAFVVLTAGLLYWVVARELRAVYAARDRARSSEAQYRILFESNPQPMWVFDPTSFRFLAVNDAAVARYGYTRDEFLGMTIADIRPADELPAARDAAARAAGLNTGLVWRHRWKDGTVRRVEVAAHDIAYAGRSARLVLALDVTDRLRAEGVLALQTEVLEAVATGASLGAALDRLAAGVEALGDGLVCSVLVLDGDRLRDGAGPSLPPEYRAAVDGLRVGPAAGSCGTAAFRRESVEVADIASDPLWDAFRHLALPHGLRACWSTPVLARDGRVLATFALYYRTPRGPRPEDRALVAAAAHVAAVAVERARAEGTLRRTQELFRAFMDNSPAIAFIKDGDGRYVYANRRWEDQFDPPRRDWAAKTDADFWPAETAAAFRASDRKALDPGRAAEVEEVVATRTGTRHFLALKFPVEDEAGRQAVGGVVLDVTEKARLEEQYRQAQKMEAVGRLAGGVAHDFNNLLTIINGNAQLIRDGLPPDDPLRPMAAQVLGAGERAADLTRQLLAYGRKQMLQPRVVDLGALVADLGGMLGRVIGEDIILTLDAAHVRVRADPGQVSQVVMNLVVNARDAMTRGGRLAVRTGAVERPAGVAADGAEVRAGRYARLEVSDTGCGMTPEVMARAFEPFFTTKGVGEGTGLGLATVYGVVKQSGGYVEIESAVGVGTTIRVCLPAADPAGATPDAGPQPAPAPPRGAESVLVVEDDDSVRSMVVEVLRSAGYVVTEAANGDRALAAVVTYRLDVDLLVTDVVMPGMGGRELADKLCAACPGLRVLFMSGYTEDAVLRHGVEQDTVYFLQKPFSPTTLATRVREVLDAGR